LQLLFGAEDGRNKWRVAIFDPAFANKSFGVYVYIITLVSVERLLPWSSYHFTWQLSVRITATDQRRADYTLQNEQQLLL